MREIVRYFLVGIMIKFILEFCIRILIQCSFFFLWCKFFFCKFKLLHIGKLWPLGKFVGLGRKSE